MSPEAPTAHRKLNLFDWIWLKCLRKEGTQLKAVALDLPSSTLETVIKYLHYRIINAGLQVEQRAEFSLEPDEALDVLNAAIYLQC